MAKNEYFLGPQIRHTPPKMLLKKNNMVIDCFWVLGVSSNTGMFYDFLINVIQFCSAFLTHSRISKPNPKCLGVFKAANFSKGSNNDLMKMSKVLFSFCWMKGPFSSGNEFRMINPGKSKVCSVPLYWHFDLKPQIQTYSAVTMPRDVTMALLAQLVVFMAKIKQLSIILKAIHNNSL